MKEALIIFIILLILLTIISVFGGSIRYAPSSSTTWQTFANSPPQRKLNDRQNFVNNSPSPSPSPSPPPPLKSSSSPPAKKPHMPMPIVSPPATHESLSVPSASDPVGTEHFASF